MATKSWTKLTNIVSEVLSATLANANVSSDQVLEAWKSKQKEVSRLLSSKAKRRKDPNAPKKAQTSYILFCGEQRKKLKESNPGLNANDTTSELGRLWKKLNPAQKKPFETLAQKDKERYTREMESYVPPPVQEHEEEQGAQKPKRESAPKDPNAPKRPCTAYLFFCTENRPIVKDENKELNGKQIITELASRWKALTESDKQPYLAMQQVDKERYEREKGLASASVSEAVVPAPVVPKPSAKAGAKPSAKTQPVQAVVAPVQAVVAPVQASVPAVVKPPSRGRGRRVEAQ